MSAMAWKRQLKVVPKGTKAARHSTGCSGRLRVTNSEMLRQRPTAAWKKLLADERSG
jgi:hypothetical protein